MKRVLLCGCVLLAACLSGGARADILKLKNGTTEDCDIVAEDDVQFTIEVQNATGTVSFKRFVKKADVAEAVRSTPEQKAAKLLQRDYVALQKYQLNPTNSFPATYYGQVITNGFLKFLANHPGSVYQTNLEDRLTQWQTELSQVSTGLVKYQGKWITAADWTTQWQQQRAQQLLAQAQQLLAQQQLANASTLLDQLCLLTNAPPDVLAAARQLRLDTYRQLPEVLTQRLQQVETELTACQQQLQQAQHDKATAIAQHKAALSSMSLGSTRPANQGTSGSLPQRATQGARGNRGGGTITVEPAQRMGADSGKVVESQTALNTANDALVTAQSCVDKLKTEQAALKKNLAAIQARAVALNLVSTNAAVTAATVVAQAPPAPVAESSDVLQDSSNWFQRYWIFLAAGLVVAVWLVSRLVR